MIPQLSLWGLFLFFFFFFPFASVETLIFETLPFLTEQPTIFPPENEIHEFFVCRETGTNSVPTPKQNKSTTGHNKRLSRLSTDAQIPAKSDRQNNFRIFPLKLFFLEKSRCGLDATSPAGRTSNVRNFFSDLINEKRLSVLPNCPMEPSGICPNGRQRPRRASID